MTDEAHAARRRDVLRRLGAEVGIDVDREDPPVTVAQVVVSLTPAVEHAATHHAMGDPYAIRWLQLSLRYAAHVMGEYAAAVDEEITAAAAGMDPALFTGPPPPPTTPR